jgi:hypothetical protein
MVVGSIHETQRIPSYVFVGRLQIKTDSIADRY